MSAFNLFARIKKSSRYYSQGLEVPHDPKSKAILFPVEDLFPGGDISHPVRFNNNRYPLEDVELFVGVGEGARRIKP